MKTWYPSPKKAETVNSIRLAISLLFIVRSKKGAPEESGSERLVSLVGFEWLEVLLTILARKLIKIRCALTT